jgi:hypothetical protein
MYNDKVEVERPVSTTTCFEPQAVIADKESNRIRIFFPDFFTQMEPKHFDETVRLFQSRGIKVTFKPLSKIEGKCMCCDTPDLCRFN